MSSDREDLSRHILPVSATMLGVCVTVISLIQVAPENAFSRWTDRLLAADSLVFLFSTFLSYWAIRDSENAARYETWADRIFLCGMILLTIVSFIVAFDLFLD